MDTFLSAHYRQPDRPYTHTRIRSETMRGGSYCIEGSDLEQFYQIYHHAVFGNSLVEHLTERHLPIGALVVDIDFRYKTPQRCYTVTHIETLITVVMEEMQSMFVRVDDVCVYVMEKPSLKVVSPETIKDGIHLLFGVCMDFTFKEMLRNRIIRRLAVAWESLAASLANDWNSVVDHAVMMGTSNWQMYGSSKPGCEVYRLTHFLNVTNEEGALVITRLPLPLITASYLPRLSVRYEGYPILSAVHPDCANEYDSIRSGAARAAKAPVATVRDLTNDVDTLGNFTSMDELDARLAEMFADTTKKEYQLKEFHMYAMLLPAEYYLPGSYVKWSRVGMALKSVSSVMFPSFLKFSSQSPDFNFTKVTELHRMWKGWNRHNLEKSLSGRSLMYWARRANYDGFQEIIKETQGYYVDEIIRAPQTNDYDVALLLHHCYKDFVCDNVRLKKWYEFTNHRWVETDSGIGLKSKISCERGIYGIFKAKLHDLTRPGVDGSSPEVIAQRKRISKILQELRQNDKKSSIMREAMELYHSPGFLERLDSKPFILCFPNCVVDFERNFEDGLSRPGLPEDMTSLCMGVPYIPLTPQDEPIVQEVIEMFNQLFPKSDLRRYMWDHLASALIGRIVNQTFNLYYGNGRNGKSGLVQLMSAILNEYKGVIPVSLFTQKRTSVGSSSSEIAGLRARRYAVMQELSVGDTTFNEGILKELTGGDFLQARALYQNSINFLPQFTLVGCTNHLPTIRSTDNGTWRRFRICPFESMFCEDPKENDPINPHQFMVDKYFDDKIDRIKVVFMAMLVKRAKETMGNVEDCETVMLMTQRYREEQDHFYDFVRKCIRNSPTGTVEEVKLKEAFTGWWRATYSKDTREPSNKEFVRYISSKYGNKVSPPGQNAFWRGISLIVDTAAAVDDITF